jgi:hypothetical protein
LTSQICRFKLFRPIPPLQKGCNTGFLQQQELVGDAVLRATELVYFHKLALKRRV